VTSRDWSEYTTRFSKDGFVHIPGVLTLGEIETLGAAVDEAVRERKQHDHRTLDEKTPYEQSFLQCQYLWEDHPEIRGLTFHPKVGELMAAVLGCERIRLWHDQALYKEAGGRETEPHQDHPYWPIAEKQTATVWIPFCKVDEECGCMGYVPGSHEGPAEFIDIFNTPGDGHRVLEKWSGRDPVYVPCEPGDVIIHHGYTVHMAKPNRSDHTRRVYTAIYFADGCHRHGNRPHPSVDRDGIALGEEIRGGATPIAWPLPGGTLPEPVAWPDWGLEWRERAERLGIIPGRR
jgi:ectoine hydroxylase-related dioxygenase (phytanoyl-CoA dioxygenase family)